jgi:hypothetical protein
MYINDLPEVVEPTAIPIMFADDTSIFIKSPNNTQLQSDLNTVFCQLSKWFHGNLIKLNLNKTHFIQFINKSICNCDIQIMIDNKHILTVKETKFLGLIIDKTLTWKEHIDYIIPKLSSACYVMRTVKPHVSHNTLNIIYYSYFHLVMNYGLLFWGSSTESIKIFKLQKKMIRDTKVIIHVEIYSLLWEYYHYLPNIFFPYSCS